MANHHFGSLADVWKHGVLLEVLTREPPARYAETHAGPAEYALVGDAERGFGVLRFADIATGDPVLTRSAYRAVVAPFLESGEYPGSALQAMTVLGDAAAYLLCDRDPASAAGLRARARELDLRGCVVAESDGMLTTGAWLTAESPEDTVVHVDPFDPHAHEPGGPSALAFAAEVVERGHRLVYWYGYDRPEQRAWAHDELSRLTTTALWCGDMMIVDADGSGVGGDLGAATTPGTGFGVVLANVAPGTVSACTDFGVSLGDAYREATLPDGSTGHLLFTSRVHRPAGSR
jgi:23S rRNA A2030 N6-methylase RlmJ